MKNIIFTGGGSGGHVVPAITLIHKIKENSGYEIYYVGSHDGVEKKLAQDYVKIYYSISTGKLRRYFSIKNMIDICKILKGLFDSFFINLKFSRKNTLVFGTGGFVSVPFVVMSKFFGKTIFIHEQTSRIGLANKICALFADKIFVSFEESLKFFPSTKTLYSGYPLRPECYDLKTRNTHVEELKFSSLDAPLLFVTGGGNGSIILNELIYKNLDWLKEKFYIIHQVGKNHIKKYESLKSARYYPIDFLDKEILDIMKLATVIISRGGAGTVAELLALKKRSIFIPLKIAQKNEQYHNAKIAQDLLGSMIITEDEIHHLNLNQVLDKFLSENQNHEYQYPLKRADEFIVSLIKSRFE